MTSQPLTPALLGQFQRLGVQLGAGPAVPEPAALLSTHEIKARGWTAAMIAKLLPTHDATRANQLEVGWSRKQLKAPVKLYQLARVEEAETTEEFLIAQAVATKGQAAATKGKLTRAQKLQAYVDGYAPELADPPEPLAGADLWRHHLRALTGYEHDHTDEYLALSRVERRRGSDQLYTKHRNAFHAKFGEKY